MFGLRSLEESDEHTGSYYAASANWVTDYPCLEESLLCDVVVDALLAARRMGSENDDSQPG